MKLRSSRRAHDTKPSHLRPHSGASFACPASRYPLAPQYSFTVDELLYLITPSRVRSPVPLIKNDLRRHRLAHRPPGRRACPRPVRGLKQDPTPAPVSASVKRQLRHPRRCRQRPRSCSIQPTLRPHSIRPRIRGHKITAARSARCFRCSSLPIRPDRPKPTQPVLQAAIVECHDGTNGGE